MFNSDEVVCGLLQPHLSRFQVFLLILMQLGEDPCG